MQTLLQVLCNGKQKKSLREKISNDANLEKYDLFLSEHKNNNRANGWAKVHGVDAKGVLNISWDSETRVLSVRAISKSGNTPEKIVSRFIEYMFAEHGKVIKSVNIVPVE